MQKPKRRQLPADRVEIPGTDRAPRARVFISYRREDTGAAAEHLHASLSQRLGADSVFRDLVTIQPGQDFSSVIDEAIRQTSVLIALIGPRWLTITGRGGRRRLDSPNDPVRQEIESALSLNVPVIPVLVDDARMPTRSQLPRSIAELAKRNAYTLPWHQGIARLERRIAEIEAERTAREEARRAEQARLDLTQGRSISPTPGGSRTASQSFNVVTRAMEMSLAYQGRRISMDPVDLAASLRKLNTEGTDEWVLFQDLVYVIDVVGVKAKRSNEQFVARSYPLRGLEDIPAQLQLGRPVLAGVTVFDSWNREPALTTGRIDGDDPGDIVITFIGVILGWDPVKQELRVLMPRASWGDKGIATLSHKASVQSIDVTTLRSIEAAPMPVPASTGVAPGGESARRRARRKR
jgi:hypothetical protein